LGFVLALVLLWRWRPDLAGCLPMMRYRLDAMGRVGSFPAGVACTAMGDPCMSIVLCGRVLRFSAGVCLLPPSLAAGWCSPRW
jgi:hypothetical protein